MKKIYLSILSIIMCLSVLSGCSNGGGNNGGNGGSNEPNTGEPSPEPATPVYSEEYTYNETHHWRALLSGEGEDKTDYAEHDNEQGKCECGMYYDCTHLLDFEYHDIDGDGEVDGYRVIGYKDEEFYGNSLYMHYEIPKVYQGEDDEEPLPVISIGYGAFSIGIVNNILYNSVPIESVKMGDNIVEIQDWAFRGSEIEELVIPDSVTNQYHHLWGSTTTGIIYNLCDGCFRLRRVVIGNGITVLGAYNFDDDVLEVVLGSSIRSIQSRAFYEIYSLEYLVIPASVNHIPEGSQLYNGKNIPLISMLPLTAKTVLYMEITKEEHDALIIPLRERDETTGNVLNPVSVGFVNGWNGNCKVYFKGEWRYNANGKPEPI
ncbi:MAG: leucine-rich repeat domain-containing protein [Clostridia bacterium]|nr:leucine-rich repeat domain-containing protein [Clostridia bacterium]